MKHLFLMLGFACLIAMLLPACAPAPVPEQEPAPEPAFDQAAQEAAIRDLVEWWYADLTLIRHKQRRVILRKLVTVPKSLSSSCGLSLIYVDENFENFDGSRNGRAATEKYWSEVFEEGFKNAVYKQSEELGIHFISPDVALYKDRYEFSGAFDKEGTPRPGKWSNAWVLVKKNGNWLMAEMVQRPIEEQLFNSMVSSAKSNVQGISWRFLTVGVFRFRGG